jgi:hypothetical protein
MIAVGQIAQLVERSPEKAGVGGSSPSLATTRFSKQLATHAVAFLSPRLVRATLTTLR